jgi:hypothetical protein
MRARETKKITSLLVNMVEGPLPQQQLEKGGHVHDCKLYNTFIAIRGKPVNAAKPTMRNIKMRVEDYVLAKLEVL